MKAKLNKKHYLYNKKCLDCKKVISDYAIKCNPCAKKGHQGRLIDGRTMKQYHCLNCKIKEISYQAAIYGSGLCRSCATKKQLENPMNHGSWQGGIRYLPYAFEFNDKLKNKIKQRDNYICQKCGKRGNTIHHIDYNKQNCKKNNLITTCKSCNSKVNFNRDYWYAYFMYIIREKGISNVKIE